MYFILWYSDVLCEKHLVDNMAIASFLLLLLLLNIIKEKKQ